MWRKNNFFWGFVILLLSIFAIIFLLTSCNKQIIDLNYDFRYAIIDGIGKIEITTWNDYAQSDMIQITDKNGTVYLTHSSNVILTNK